MQKCGDAVTQTRWMEKVSLAQLVSCQDKEDCAVGPFVGADCNSVHIIICASFVCGAEAERNAVGEASEVCG